MTSLISSTKVPPSGPDDAEIMIIGEAPGYEEDKDKAPFLGDAGEKLNEMLGIAGLNRKNIRITNVCNYRPNNNKWDHLIDSPQLAEGIREITQYIDSHRSTLKFVVLCGEKPLEYIGRRHGITKWRGSVIKTPSGVNLFASLHPANILYNPHNYHLLAFDFRRLSRYLQNGYKDPERNYTINPTGIELEECLREIESYKEVSVDFEGVKGTSKILCCGFGLSKSRAICLVNSNWANLDHTFYLSIKRILENPNIHKIFQNGFGYDIEVARLNGINVEGYTCDTMICAHILEPELPYDLAYLTSINTDRPFYKDKGRSALPDDNDKGWSETAIKRDGPIIWEYNCDDCCATYEIKSIQWSEIVQKQLLLMYDYKHSLIEVGQYLSRPGLYLDVGHKELLRIGLKQKWKYYQEILNTIAGYAVNTAGNAKSLHKFLLEDLGLPERRDQGKVTLDEDAIVSYISLCQGKIDEYKTAEKIDEWTLKLAANKCIILIRGFRTNLSRYVNVKTSDDGRVRSVYNLPAGAETARATCHKNIDGTGWNAQTLPREVLEFTDEEMTLIEAKLNAG